MNEKINIIYGSINSYSTEHGRSMQILYRLAKTEAINIFWIDPPTNFREIKKFLKQHITKYSGLIYGTIKAISPLGLPFYHTNKLSWFATKHLLDIYINRMNTECDLVMISSPIFLKYAKSMQKKGIPIVYDCRDVFSKWEHVSEYAISEEKELISISNVVITSSEGIKNEVLNINNNANVIAIPNGVPRSMINKCPKKTKDSKPRVGFVGHMGYYVDLDLVIEIAKKMQNLDFILVGDHTYIMEIVKNAPKNCIFMGEIPFESLNELYCTFDIGIIPFKVNGLTNPIIPIKLIEYFAKGLPVVCSPLEEVKRIDKDNLIHYANGKEDWINKIEIALEDGRQDRFIEFANDYTWENATERYMSIIEDLVAQSQKHN